MEREPARAAAVERLLSSPALSGLTPLEKEEQVLLLLRSQAPEMAGLLAGELRRATDSELEPRLEVLAARDGACAFSAGLQNAPVDGERCRAQTAAFLRRLLRHERARAALCAPLAAVERDLPGRYLPPCFANGGYVHFELTKVERLHLAPGEAASFLREALLLRAGIFLADGPAGGLGPRFAAEAQTLLRGELKSLPQAVLRSAVMSHLPCQGNPLLPASARLTALFAAAARAGASGPVRGALPAETSWWGVALHNAAFHGLDASMLEEMRGIAARNGW